MIPENIICFRTLNCFFIASVIDIYMTPQIHRKSLAASLVCRRINRQVHCPGGGEWRSHVRLRQEQEAVRNTVLCIT